MKINFLILLIIVSTIGAWTYLSNHQTIDRSPSPKKVRNFEFEKRDGTKSNLYDYEGQNILLHFWATWCTPCVEELPRLIMLAQNNPENFIVIAIAVSDKKKSIARFLSKIKKEIPENFIIGLDLDKSISKDTYGTIKLPETYVITPNLALLEKITGAQEDW